jgi:hypothetical protein
MLYHYLKKLQNAISCSLFVRIPQACHSVEVTTETRRQVSRFDVIIFRSNSE